MAHELSDGSEQTQQHGVRRSRHNHSVTFLCNFKATSICQTTINCHGHRICDFSLCWRNAFSLRNASAAPVHGNTTSFSQLDVSKQNKHYRWTHDEATLHCAGWVSISAGFVAPPTLSSHWTSVPLPIYTTIHSLGQ